MMLGILFGLFFLLLFIGMPVAYGMVISAVVTLFFDSSLTGIIIPQKLFTGMDSFSLMAVPFFMLAGTLMEKSGITDILVNWAKSLVGHFKGGLGHATIVTGVGHSIDHHLKGASVQLHQIAFALDCALAGRG